jgi:DNA-directed RNA polymerase specialized sigma24 family protein
MERQKVADEGLRRALVAMVRGRVPPHEVDEIVQETLADAFESKTAPAEADALERWVRGIARHKVADYHRRAKREVTVEPDSLASARVTDGSAHDAADLLRWAEKESNDATLDWLLREGDGEKLQSIADEARVPAATVRQRVARLRRHYRARWAAQIAAAITLGVLITLALRPRKEPPPVTAPVASASAPVPNPAIELRRFALTQCEKKQWSACLDGLDRAAELDPAGDQSQAIGDARSAAKKALEPPAPAPSPSSKPLVTDGGPKKTHFSKPVPKNAYQSKEAAGF